jgi:hypothetical protein
MECIIQIILGTMYIIFYKVLVFIFLDKPCPFEVYYTRPPWLPQGNNKTEEDPCSKVNESDMSTDAF